MPSCPPTPKTGTTSVRCRLAAAPPAEAAPGAWRWRRAGPATPAPPPQRSDAPPLRPAEPGPLALAAGGPAVERFPSPRLDRLWQTGGEAVPSPDYVTCQSV